MKNEGAKSGKPKTQTAGGKQGPPPQVKLMIPPLEQGKFLLKLVGDRPLLLNSKMGIVGERIATEYECVKGKRIKPPPLTPDEQYAAAFYTLPDSKHEAPHEKGRYGVPASGIKKCFRTAVRLTGITDNTTIGLIGKSFFVLAEPGDSGGLVLIRHEGFVRDSRLAPIGSGAMKTPQHRYRPLFPKWELHVPIVFNMRTIDQEQIVNLAMHAGQYVGLCEMRAEKDQGQCGGFMV